MRVVGVLALASCGWFGCNGSGQGDGAGSASEEGATGTGTSTGTVETGTGDAEGTATEGTTTDEETTGESGGETEVETGDTGDSETDESTDTTEESTEETGQEQCPPEGQEDACLHPDDSILEAVWCGSAPGCEGLETCARRACIWECYVDELRDNADCWAELCEASDQEARALCFADCYEDGAVCAPLTCPDPALECQEGIGFCLGQCGLGSP